MSLLAGVAVRPSGETAVVLELGDRIDRAVHRRVLALDAAITADPPVGVVELVPTYRSLLVRLDHTVTTPDELVAALASRPAADVDAPEPTVHEVAVSFGLQDAEDLDEVAGRTGVTRDEVVQLLTAAPLWLAFHGFVPGFAYLAGVPATLDLPRRPTPRPAVRPGSVLLAAGQAALCPAAMPTGWWVVGRTGHPLFDAATDPPVAFAPGDEIRLVAT